MRILIADDDRISRRILRASLSAYDVREACDGEEAWQMLQEEFAPLLITDWQMPYLDGPDLIQRIRNADFPSYVYCMLLTVRDNQVDRIRGIDAGADDYLVKPLNTIELNARLSIALRIINLEQQLRANNDALRSLNDQLLSLNEQLHFQASHDPLTELLNRLAIMDHARAELARNHRTGAPLSIALVDLDFFKSINDRYGHLVGDAALKHVARLMRKAVRPYDWVGRWGGEEFLLLLPGAQLEEAQVIAERLRMLIETTPLALETGIIVNLTASIGIAPTGNDEQLSIDELFLRADQALYAAKAAGRNCVYTHEIGD
jgi:two-component system chemotaxis response regulator CheY